MNPNLAINLTNLAFSSSPISSSSSLSTAPKASCLLLQNLLAHHLQHIINRPVQFTAQKHGERLHLPRVHPVDGVERVLDLGRVR